MKLLNILLVLLFLASSALAQKKGVVDRHSKSFTLQASLDDRYTLFGYAAPDEKSEILIQFSTYPHEVNANREKFRLGAYSETGGLKPGDKILFDSEKDGFVKLNYIRNGTDLIPFYMRARTVKMN
ncbi:MAG: hypothetical protein WKF88_09870 [Ferruginibacter sp.]